MTTASAIWDRLADLPCPTLGELFSEKRDGGEGAGEPGGAKRVAMLSGRIELGDGAEDGGILFDWSKTHLTGELIDAFLTLAQEQGFAAQRDALFAGEAVNNTEGRAAEHPAERGEAGCAGVLQRSHFHASRQCHCQRGDSGGPDRGGAEHLFPILRPL